MDREIDGQLNQDIDAILDEIARGQNHGVVCNEGLGRLVTGIEMARKEIKDLKRQMNELAEAWSAFADAVIHDPDETQEGA